MRARYRHKRGSFTLAVDSHIPEKGLTALFGPSGCGKTTLLRCIAGLDRPAEGRLEAFDKLWHDTAAKMFTPAHKRPFGLVFQESNLFEHLTVDANIRYGLKRTPSSEQQFRIRDIIHLLGIDHLLTRKPLRLSGGERQRVALARALLTTPRLLLMDEPLSALDIQSKMQIFPFLERIRDQLQVPIIYVSHSLQEVSRLADHMVVMHEGSVSASGPINDIATRLDLPMERGDEAGATLTGRIMEHDHTYHLSGVECEAGTLWIPLRDVPIGSYVRVHVAAREVSLSLSGDLQTSNLNTIAAVVESIRHYGEGTCMVRLRSNGVALLSRITLRSKDLLELEPGKKIYAYIKTAAIRV